MPLDFRSCMISGHTCCMWRMKQIKQHKQQCVCWLGSKLLSQNIALNMLKGPVLNLLSRTVPYPLFKPMTKYKTWKGSRPLWRLTLGAIQGRKVVLNHTVLYISGCLPLWNPTREKPQSEIHISSKISSSIHLTSSNSDVYKQKRHLNIPYPGKLHPIPVNWKSKYD